MDKLPTELHVKILRYLPGLLLEEGPLPESDLRSSTLFPFNAASVCTLWLSILSEIPDCWTRVVFDVANDPAPLLEAFHWSKDLNGIDVLVFSSSGPSVVHKKVERRRAFAIAQALRPHIHRCRSIVFDVIYSTSLPPAHIFLLEEVPDLEELCLDCEIDNIEIIPDSWMTAVVDRPPLVTSLPSLKRVTLTGFLFMYLALQFGSPEWLKGTQRPKKKGTDITITQFAFRQTGPYTVENFFHYLLGPMKGFHSLSLCKLSLSYRYEGSDAQEPRKQGVFGHEIHFDSPSTDFFMALGNSGKFIACGSATFEHCTIPPNLNQDWLRYFRDLTLRNIVDDDHGGGLCGILDWWDANNVQHDLRIEACPSFNDSTLNWFKPRKPGMYSAEKLNHWYLHDCTNFAPTLLREVIQARNENPVRYFTDIYHETRLRKLVVTGRGPTQGLTEDDKKWFNNQSFLIVQWTTENEHGVKEEFFTTSGE